MKFIHVYEESFRETVGNDVCFGGKSLSLILGPCVIESRDHSLMMAESICEITTRLGLNVIFKSSFDKANRSSFSSYRGPGLDKGLSILYDVKQEIGCPVITDIMNPQAKKLQMLLMLFKYLHFIHQTELLVLQNRHTCKCEKRSISITLGYEECCPN